MSIMNIRVKYQTANGDCCEGGLEELQQWQNSPEGVIWIDIQGQLSDTFKAELLAMGCEEGSLKLINHAKHPPKIERLDTSTFILWRGIRKLGSDFVLIHQQIGLFIGDNFIISISSNEDSRSTDVVWRTTNSFPLCPSKIAEDIMLSTCNRYLRKMIQFEQKLEILEDELQITNSKTITKELVTYRYRLRKLRRLFDYHHRIALQLEKNELEDQTYSWHDLSVISERLHGLTKMYYDISGDLLEGHISISTHELNHAMRVLTVISAVFIPLGFIAGIYGMNFENMPELQYENAYYYTLFFMFSVAAILFTTFRLKKWI